MLQVEWLQTALNQLITIWTQGDGSLRLAITVATHQIDQKLQADPYGSSESRPEEEGFFLSGHWEFCSVLRRMDRPCPCCGSGSFGSVVKRRWRA